MNILLPTDFSENAEKAAQLAIAIAEKAQGQLFCFHSYDLPYSNRSISTSLMDAMKKNARENMLVFQQKVQSKSIKIHTELLVGNPIRVTKELVKRRTIDMVVMGTQGASGLEEYLIGSNAASVIQNVDVPVLVVPPQAEVKPFERIVLAADLDLKEKERPLQRLKAFANLFEARIDVVHVGEEDTENENVQFLEKVLEDTPHTYLHLRDENVENAILKESESRSADLLCAITKKYGFFEGLFHQSFTSKLAYHTTIPLLALHEPR